MAYKRYFYRNGKKFGPYYYESYRDKNGEVKKRYLGRENPDKKKISVGKLVFFGVFLFALVAFSFYVSLEDDFLFGREEIGSALSFVKGFASSSYSGIVGFVVDDSQVGGEEQVTESLESGGADSVSQDSLTQEEVSDSVSSENGVTEEGADGGVGGIIGGVDEVVLPEEESVVEDVGVESLNENVSMFEEVLDNVSEVVENVSEIENVSVGNESVNVSVGNVMDVNISDVLNESVLNESNVSDLNISNVSVVENVSVGNVTGVNISEGNVSVNDSVGNVSGANVSVRQYRAVVGREVKWIKKVVANKSGNVSVDVPLRSRNISVKSGREVLEAESEADEYERLVDEVDREDIADGTITGFVAKDVKMGKGIFFRLWDWIKSFTISGNVIDEVELETSGDIIETNESKIVKLDRVVDEELTKGDKAEVAVEYYTDAPLSEESEIERGKRVVVSANDEFNYSNVLAYSRLNNSVRVNSSRLKIYWVKEVVVDDLEEENKSVVKEKIEKKEKKEKKEEKGKGEVEEKVGEIGNVSVVENVSKVENVSGGVEGEENVSDETEGEENVSGVEDVSNSDLQEGLPSEEVEGVDEEVGEVSGGEGGGDKGEIGKEKKEKVEKEKKEGKEKEKEVGKEKDEKKVEKVEEEVEEEMENVITGEVVRGVGKKGKKVVTEIVRVEVNYSAFDLDGDGMVDYVEWVVPHLSNQTYEIIYITGAEHLDENRSFVEDVYKEVSEKDDNLSKVIPDDEYIRVTFEKNLTREKDITIYVRANCNGTILINNTVVPCEVYEKKKRIDEIRRWYG